MVRFRNISLKNKIFSSILLVMLLISVLIALLARYILISSLTKELEHRGIAIAQSIADRGSSHVLDKDLPKLLVLSYEAAQLGERKYLVNYIFIADLEHQVLAHTFVRPFPASLRTANDIPANRPHSVKLLEVDGEPTLDIAVPMLEGIYQIATVHVGLNKRHIDNLVSKLRFTFLGFISLVCVIIFLLSHYISRYITQPVSRLIRMSDEISKGNLNFRLDLGKQYADLMSEHGREERCPAYHNSDLPCWHVARTMGPVGGEAMIEKPAYCRECVIRHKQIGDEVLQLADSFLYMVRSVKLYRNRLAESEAKYRSLFDAGPDPVFVLRLRTLEIVDANPRAEQIYGYDMEELLGMSFRELEPTDNVDTLDSFRQKPFTLGACVFFPKIIHRRKDGSPFFVNMHACGIKYADEDAIIVSTTNITDMIEKDAQLIQASKMTTLGEMSAGIAHELNQPLTAIKMGADFLRRVADQGAPLQTDQMAKVTSEIGAQVVRAKEIINTLRQFGRKADLAVERVNLNEPVRAVMKLVSQQMKLQNIDVRLDLDNGLPRIQAQDNRLQQVFFNLLTNARDAINAKRRNRPDGESTITVRTFQRDGKAALTVTDTGTGIPAAKVDKIFEPFYTTKETGQGMGLGLAISYGIVKDYGGEIQVDSEEGVGTTFTLTFPIFAA
ncbi:MAG: ATP-binding protein [Thermodesulfobacteriota bacterium]